jgi:hypothetical protein
VTAPTAAVSALVLVNAQAAAREATTTAVLAAVRRALRLVGDWYDGDEVDRFVGSMASTVGTGRTMVAGSTETYLRLLLGQQGVRVPRRLDPPAAEPRGIPVTEEYVRPVKEYRYARLRGLDELEAEERALTRAETIAGMDLDLAVRDTAAQVVDKTPGVIGYRRVIHPELNRAGAGGHAVCGLCIAASDRLYRTGTLLPIHEWDYCEVAPVVGKVGGDGDPGHALNAEALGQLYEAAGSTSADALKRTRFTVHQHGELGPVLRRAGDAFRDEADVEEDTGKPLDLTGEGLPGGAGQPAL